MANLRMYQLTSLGRPLKPGVPPGKVVVYAMAVAALLGLVVGWARGGGALAAVIAAGVSALGVFGAWALARELMPDDKAVAYLSMAAGLLVVLWVASPGLLVLFVTLGLVRMVNRSGGLPPKPTDSLILMALSIWVIYSAEMPLFGLVAAVAFALDGSLREPLRAQWVHAMLCLGGSIVYMVDHDIGLGALHWPNTLVEWFAVLFILIFALDALLLKRVRSRGDVDGLKLDLKRVRSGMLVGLLAAIQGIHQPHEVVIIVATIAGLCIGIAFRKRFRVAPA